jgi:hypothetical protein
MTKLVKEIESLLKQSLTAISRLPPGLRVSYEVTFQALQLQLGVPQTLAPAGITQSAGGPRQRFTDNVLSFEKFTPRQDLNSRLSGR